MAESFRAKSVVRFRNISTGFTALAGLLFLFAGGKVFDGPKQGTWSTVAYGVGSSLLAAAIATWVTIREEMEADTIAARAHQLAHLGVRDAFRSRNALGDNFWKEKIDKAKDHYRVLGTANHRYLGTELRRRIFSAAMKNALSRKVEVEILFLNPESPPAERREGEENRGTRADIAESVGRFWAMREEITDKAARARLKLLEYTDTPTCGITWVDDTLIVSTYLAKKLNLEAPGLILSDESSSESLTRAYTGNYLEIRGASTEFTEERVQELQTKIQEWRASGGHSEAHFDAPQ